MLNARFNFISYRTVQLYKLPHLYYKNALDLFVQVAFQPREADKGQKLINFGNKGHKPTTITK